MAGLCWQCQNYTFRRNDEPGTSWAYCEHHSNWFPNSQDWAKGEGTKPGERTCQHWKERDLDE